MGISGRAWYVTLIAGYYLAMCSVSGVRYVSLYFGPDAGTVPLAAQLLCLLSAFSAALYFYKPRLGHKGLLAVTLVTLISIGSDAEATAFHMFVLLALLWPLWGVPKPPKIPNHSASAAIEG